MTRDFQPGDRIVKRGPTIKVERTLTVADPVRTSRGKLRLTRENGSILTTWWRHPATGYRLPRHYHLDGGTR